MILFLFFLLPAFHLFSLPSLCIFSVCLLFCLFFCILIFPIATTLAGILEMLCDAGVSVSQSSPGPMEGSWLMEITPGDPSPIQNNPQTQWESASCGKMGRVFLFFPLFSFFFFLFSFILLTSSIFSFFHLFFFSPSPSPFHYSKLKRFQTHTNASI